MGLLTNPSNEDKFPRLFVSYHKKICFFSYVIGLIWFFLLSYKPLGLGIYFSENALLPGLVRGSFDCHNEAKYYLETLKLEADAYLNEIPVPWLLASFKQLGLDAFTHDFVVQKPLSKTNHTGSNVYAILRAPRSIGTEALLLSTPYRSENTFLPSTLPSIALMLAVAKCFRKHTYWSKDIIFLITDDEQLGMQAWIEAYHQSSISDGVLLSGDLPGRSGSIQAALNLEIQDEKINVFDVKIEGLNGQLPNLDFFNLATHQCRREGFQVTFKGRRDSAHKNDYYAWKHSLKTLMAMMRSQATGVPSGNHGLLHRFHIEALTLEGKTVAKYGKTQGFGSLGMVVEGIFRSLNNLLERFHQSYFFYLLPSTTRFVSIGLYMPPFSLLALGLLIKALALRFETVTLDEKQKTRDETKVGDEGKEATQQQVDYSFSSVLPFLVLTHMVGLLICLSPEYFSQIGSYFLLKMQASVFAGIISVFFATLVIPTFISMKSSSGMNQSWIVLKCVSLLELAMLLFGVAFINFSLACLITLIYVPICIGISPSKTKLMRWIKGLPVLLASPLALLFLFVTHDTLDTFPELSTIKLLQKSFFATRHSLLYSIVDGYIYGNWLFSVGSTLLFPIWLQFWIITQLRV